MPTTCTLEDHLTIQHTAFVSFADMLGAAGSYRPSFYLGGKTSAEQAQVVELANAYDRAQMARGDDRRAFRGDFKVTSIPEKLIFPCAHF